MSVFSRMPVAMLLVLPIFSQQPPGRGGKVPVKASPAATAQNQEGLTTDGVARMVEAGLSDDVILARLHKENKAFDLSADDMIRLKKAKVSDAVLQAMIDPKAELKPAPTAVAPVPQPATIQVPSIQIPVIPAIATANRSGATPAPGASAAGDPNDPLAPHDSGIYVYTNDREGKPQMIVLERASYQGSKTGGMLQSAMTYGISKAKTKAVIPGAHAGIRISDPAPVFYFYFDDKQAGLGKTTYFGSNNVSNPNQFSLLRLEVTKQNRETTVGQFSALGGSSGTDSKSMVQFKSERIRPGLYKVTVESIKAGEYCFLASSGMVGTGMAGAYGAGMTAAADIFDFGVSVE